MASLRKRKGTSRWFCCWRTAAGERRQRSTKQTDRTRAWEVCLSIARAEELAYAGRINEAAVRRILSDIHERTTGETVAFQTVRQWLESWAAQKVEARSEATGERYRQVVREFLKSLGKRAALPLDALNPQDILKFRTARLARGVSNQTANQDIKIISVALAAAHRLGYVQTNVARAVDSLEARPRERSALTPEQVGLIVSAAGGGDWRLATLLGFYVGGRLRDMVNLKWGDIDLQNGTLTFTPLKTRKPVMVPLHHELRDELLALPSTDDPTAPLMPSLAGRPTGGRAGLSRQFTEIVKRAGLAAPPTEPTARPGGRRQSQLSFHCLRHGNISALAGVGVSEEVRRVLAGHSSPETHKRYTHHEVETLRAAVEKLPGVGRTKKGRGAGR